MSMSQWVVSTRAMARGEGALLPLPATGPGAVVLGTLLDKELFSAIWGPAIAAIRRGMRDIAQKGSGAVVVHLTPHAAARGPMRSVESLCD